MFIEPSLELLHEVGAIRAPRELLFEPAHDIAALMLGHRHETQRPIGDDLMVEERAFARFVEGA